MAVAQSNAKPVDLGARNFETIARLLNATGNALSSYRSASNDPRFASTKIAAWNEYQSCIAELMEALHG